MSGSGANAGPPGGVNTGNFGAYSHPNGPDRGWAPNPNGDGGARIRSTDERIRENEARSRRNDERQVRREAGEENIEEDEDLLEIEPNEDERTQPTTQTLQSQVPGGTTSGGGGEGSTPEGMNIFVTQAIDLLDGVLNERKAKSSKTLGKLEEAVEDPNARRGVRRKHLDRRLITLLKLGFHLPLTLCTNEAIELVRAQPTLLVDKRYTDSDGNKVTIVDVHAGWPDECEISSEDWKDAWANLLEVLPEVFLLPEAVERFRAHYEFLIRQTNFKVRFPAIRRFDIDIRHNYFWGKECWPFHPGSPEYVSDLIQCQNDIAMERMTLGDSTRTEEIADTERAEGEVEVAEETVAGPFGGGRMSSSTGPLCLICATSGHQPPSACLGTQADEPRVEAGHAPEVPRRTSAPSAGPRAITPVVSGACERDRIITTYRAEAFEQELRRWGLWEKHHTLIAKLLFGFHIGDMRPLTKTFTPENHKGARENIDFVINYTSEQVKLGHMTGPYSEERVRDILGTHFRSSPLSVVPKSSLEPHKFCLIQNCSFRDEDGMSVNDMISADEFPMSWGTAAEVAEIICNAPAGTQMATLDVDSAFRRIPIYPAHKQYLVIQQRPGEFFIDHVCPFGVRSGPGLQGAPMDAIVDILDARGWGPNKKWVDDLNNFRYPLKWDAATGVGKYAHSIDDIFDLGERLGLPWHKDKWKPHAFTGEYLGFAWHIPNRTVSLPDRKRMKYWKRVVDALETVKERSRRIDLVTTQKVSGSLAHATFVYPRGRTYLTGLYTFIASFTNEYTPRYPPKSVIADLKWWQNLLARPGELRTLAARGPAQDLDLWVDASTSWGIGMVVGDSWDAWRWKVEKAKWNKHSRDIGWAEMVAIELLLRRLVETGWKNADLLVRSDNEGVIKAFRRGRSRNWQVNLSIQCAELLCMERNIQLSPIYVNTKDNRADLVSRSIPDPKMVRFHSKFRLPEELSEFLEHV
ncbi:hypothetical protein BN946_scf184911.g66 [Trametes cinnabarina]|uniref:Uncharacterized protein n=1 Tax=Pycnoporus cinnabarinus TaxID=5643 RepID=A0A060SBH8_PYCCI|nr:hypothetical protein BN946_scf184911.g66 [Trametes cinnabarina]